MRARRLGCLLYFGQRPSRSSPRHRAISFPQPYAKGNGGADQVRILSDGKFVGGPGNDRISTGMSAGVFKGGPGYDRAKLVEGGVFYGLAGSDVARKVTQAGVFRGGRGADRVWVLDNGGEFRGARGRHKVTGAVYNATFDGGPHKDSAVVAECSTTEVLSSVELVSSVGCA